MSRVIVSNSITAIPGYIVYKSVNDVQWMGVDVFIFNSCVDEDITTVFTLNSMPSGLEKIFYVNNTIDPLLYNLFNGVSNNVYIYNDESLLADRESIDFLVDNAGQMGTEVKSASSDITTIENFIDKLTNSTPKEVSQMFLNKNWVKTLEATVQSMSTSLALTDSSGAKLVDFVDNVNRHITELENNAEKTTQEIHKLKETVNSLTSKQLGASAIAQSGPTKYGTYPVPNIIRKVIYVKCYGDVNYLTTFFCAFHYWLKSGPGGNLNSRILIARPQLSSYMMKYANVAKITSQSAGMMDCKRSFLYVTFEPNKKVLDAFFNDNLNVYFVLDFMQSDTALVSGRSVVTFNAYSSPSLYAGLKSKSDKAIAPAFRTIFSMDAPTDDANASKYWIIPRIENFHNAQEVERKSKHFTACKDLYLRMKDIVKEG